MRFKRGVTMVALIVTIIVALILISVSVVGVKKSIDKAALVAYAEDLSNIERATQNYYAENDEFPTNSQLEKKYLSQAEMITLSGGDGIVNDLKTNGDYVDNGNLGSYYKIDLGMLDVTSSARGMEKDGAKNDIYVVSYPSMNVYYLKGYSLNGKVYYSLTADLVQTTKIVNKTTEDNSYTTVQTVSGVTITRPKRTWTNKMGITMQATLSTGDSLALVLPNGTEKLFTNVVVGKNEILFDSLEELKNTPNNMMGVQSLTDADISTFHQLAQQSKYIEIVKKQNGIEAGRIRVNLQDYEVEKPGEITTPTVSSKEDSNWLEFKVADARSGIKAVRYDYIAKYDDTGNRVNYYAGVDTLSEDYLKSKGQKASVSEEGFVQMKIPKNIEGVQVAIIDKAGNVATFTKNMYEDIGVYIGIVPKQISLKQATFKLVLNAIGGVSTGTTAVSTDGANFTAPQTFTINKNDTVTSIDIDSYTNLDAKENIYVKVTAKNKSGSKTETRVASLNELSSTQKDGMKIGQVAQENATINGEAPTYFNPVIPKGFKAVNTATAIWPNGWDNGLVIEDTAGNQFVWVPVDGTKVTYQKNNTYPGGVTAANTTDDALPAGITNENDQVTKYGGFYLARYEAMLDYHGGDMRIASRPSKNGSNALVSFTQAFDGYTINNINYGDAKRECEQMATKYEYSTDAVVTGLPTGKQWDTACNWISSVANVLDGNAWGNYYTSIPPASTGNYQQAVVKPSGSNENWKAKNIYDFAGNLYEWTSEKYSTSFLIRSGGFHGSGGINNPANRLTGYSNTYIAYNLGFRAVLYIK